MKQQSVSLKFLQVTTGTLVPTATVVLKFGDHERMAIATGNGPVDAAVSAIKTLINEKVVLGVPHAGHHPRFERRGARTRIGYSAAVRSVHGFAAHTDTTRASIEAFLDAARTERNRTQGERRSKMGRTLLDKIWDAHTVRTEDGGRSVLYIDRQYIHEVTSPVAFAGLERRGIGVARPAQITATADHNIPTVDQHLPIAETESRRQVEALEANCAKFGIEHFGVGNPRQGIVHIIGPELGFTQPGMTIVCGDSHTSTHGALGAVAFGVGTSEVEMVFASQCIIQSKPRSMRITVDRTLRPAIRN